jgi:transcriptional regulator with XRE-family HTH domain
MLGMSQSRVAELTGKEQSQIARMESGHANPSFLNASQVLRSLGVELVAVPVRLLPAVRHLIDAAEGLSPPIKTRLVGNDPEAAGEEQYDS